MSNFKKENAAAILRVPSQYPEVKRMNRCLAKAAAPKFPQEQTILIESFFVFSVLLFTSLAWEPDTVIISLTLIDTITLDVCNCTQETAIKYKSAYCSMKDKVPVR